jgi:hypothetical protein
MGMSADALKNILGKFFLIQPLTSKVELETKATSLRNVLMEKYWAEFRCAVAVEEAD